jgi:predicted secreted protein
MSILTGNNGVVKMDNAAGTLVAIAAVRSFTIDITSDTIETSHMGVDSRTYVKGMSSWSGSADIYFDPTEMPTSVSSGLVGLNPTLEAVGSDPYTVELYLDDTAYKFSGECIITGFSVNSSMDGMVEASISFQGSGAATYAAS